ncbi:MAG TPA: enoyl-CoA hydratase [Gemmatimonadaceae bacterium]|jgi:enoyl-CoA hydratase/carnithine racemase|nr:enoyl-CoA hydratase [Gemmatimonadaceae bacterium]
MSADAGAVRLEQRGTIAFVTFDRPSARNAMTWAMYEQLGAALDRIEANETLRVVVLRGAGGHFASGTDIAQFVKFETGDDGASYERDLEIVVTKLESMRAATIAAVNGYAAGAGLVLAAACDLRIATPDARFGVPIARTVGNCLSMINYARLVAALGVSRTKAMLLTADFILAGEARAMGFVAAIAEHDVFDTALNELCARVASHAPITIQATKDAIRRIADQSLVDSSRGERSRVGNSRSDGDDLVRRAYASRDFHEGVAAYIEKRSPQWEGR